MPRHMYGWEYISSHLQDWPFFFWDPWEVFGTSLRYTKQLNLNSNNCHRLSTALIVLVFFLHWRFMTCNIGLIENWVPQPRMVCIPSYVPIKVRILRDILHFRTNSYHIFWYFFLIYYIAIYCHILPYITIYYHILPYITIYYHQSISFL